MYHTFELINENIFPILHQISIHKNNSNKKITVKNLDIIWQSLGKIPLVLFIKY